MAKCSLRALLTYPRREGFRRSMRVGAACAGVLSLAGCAEPAQHTPARPEAAQASGPPGAAYRGWRVFQDQCGRCHGPAAAGNALAPDLLPRVRGLDSRTFVDLLLTRYEWTVAPAQPSRPDAQRDAWIDDIVQRKKGALALPARPGEPALTAYIVDLYAYLSARADGTQGPDRPVP